MSIENFYYSNILGQIKSLRFPFGPNGNELFCRYDIVTGDDWELVSGIKTGITQCASYSRFSDEIIFNMPIECTFKSTNVYGWPQIIFSIYGTNSWGTEVNLGYARIHVPCLITNEKRKMEPTIIKAPILILKATSFWTSMINAITNRHPELRDPKILADGTKTKNLFTFSNGSEVIVSLECITKGTDKLNFDY